MKLVVLMLLMFFVVGRFSSRIDFWTYLVVFTGVCCLLLAARLAFHAVN